ncbi:unnamed protein product [Cuscuta europaea]|uniref:Polygalacturonase n=2 Tax=Cuscuta europaea TaxID=41803 RepID=A0A9P0ZEK7_CUSEU|nr:unnamed protein product [Cuscuta europaea]
MFVRSPLIIFITIICSISCLDCSLSDDERTVISVDQFGTQGDDDSQAFRRAWDIFCHTKAGLLLIPMGTYFLKPISFDGPCNPNLTMKIEGTIKAWPDKREYETSGRLNWMLFRGLHYFNVGGGGTIDGNGKHWWKQSCNSLNNQLHSQCDNGSIPFSVMFENCTNLKVENLWFTNAQKMHLTLNITRHVELSRINIEAPFDSLNTDGIHISRSHNISITHSTIKTGDDCISIVNRTSSVRILDINCGPGHGISIGSLGRLGNQETESVSDIVVKGAKFKGTSNGVRIKTWQGGKGMANNITFENIEMDNVMNPIIIDQFYCAKFGIGACDEQKNAVNIRSVLYKNITGTSASDVAILFNCSKTYSCQDIELENVTLSGVKEQEVKASCSLVLPIIEGDVFPRCV